MWPIPQHLIFPVGMVLPVQDRYRHEIIYGLPTNHDVLKDGK